jgi:hypothetical protein
VEGTPHPDDIMRLPLRYGTSDIRAVGVRAARSPRAVLTDDGRDRGFSDRRSQAPTMRTLRVRAPWDCSPCGHSVYVEESVSKQ